MSTQEMLLVFGVVLYFYIRYLKDIRENYPSEYLAKRREAEYKLEDLRKRAFPESYKSTNSKKDNT